MTLRPWLQAELGGLSFDALLEYFGAASYKKLLVAHHPDRAPQVAMGGKVCFVRPVYFTSGCLYNTNRAA